MRFFFERFIGNDSKLCHFSLTDFLIDLRLLSETDFTFSYELNFVETLLTALYDLSLVNVQSTCF